MKGTELIVLKELNPAVLLTDGGMKKTMDFIRGKLDEFEPDLETAAGRKEIASMSRAVSSSKVHIKTFVDADLAESKAKIAKVNGLWKPTEKTLNQWRDETRQPLTDYEAEQDRIEAERKAGIKERIRGFSDAFFALNGMGTQEQLADVIVELETLELTPEIYFNFLTDAIEKRDAVLTAAQQNLETRIRLDKEEADRKAEAERLAAERLKQEEEAANLKREQEKLAAAQKKVDDEKAALESEKKAEQERKDREEFERKAKIQAEQEAAERVESERIAKEKEKADAEARRIAKEQAEAEEAARAEALKPDREKLEGFSQFISGIEPPQVTSDEAAAVVRYADGVLTMLSDAILEKAEDM